MSMKMNQANSDQLYKIRHSAAHVMAQAVLELYPEARLGIGPPIEAGFYYDFDLGVSENGKPKTFRSEDLAEIEKRMRRIISENHIFRYRVITPEEALKFFEGQSYKLELISAILSEEADEYGDESAGNVVLSTYRQDNFEDLCRGPHVESTGEIPLDALRLMSVAGAYWRGDETRPMLQRVYGTVWLTQQELDDYILGLEEAKARDHRKLGRELEIFFFDDEIGGGLPLWQPRGTVIIEELEKLAKEVEFKAGYERVRTPHLTKEDLFYRSGHLPFYAESMYPPLEMDGVNYYVKPMNCPFHHKIYSSRPRSYRDLPVRLAEYGTCYRYEKSGELFGLMRVRSLQMNDAHLYCTEEQFEGEFLDVVGMYLGYFKLFGIGSYEMRLSTHHPRELGKKYVDNSRLWIKTEEMVRQAMLKGGVPFVEAADEAAFYGPKIDVQIRSAIGREFTLATNQVDFAVPERFNLKFVDRDGSEKTPLCIHRAPLSTHERFVGFLLEHYAGNFPTWLSPEQVKVIPVADKFNEYAGHIVQGLRASAVRASADLGPERMSAKIRRAQLMKIPHMLIIGAREVAESTVSVRTREGIQEDGLSFEAFHDRICKKISQRNDLL